MFNKYGRIADYVYTCRNKISMDNIVDKIKAVRRDEYKAKLEGRALQGGDEVSLF